MNAGHNEHGYEGVDDSVMIRTLEGRISSWNRPSEDLYGWREEEAVGQVSHRLLQTQFPKPLEEIESDLVRIGQWEGRLVHTTRDGNQVVVDSRWILKLRGDDRELVEINKRFTEGALNGAVHHAGETGAAIAPQTDPTWKKKADAWIAKCINLTLVGSAVVLIVGLVAYGIFGHALIKTIYESDTSLFARYIMQGRMTTRLGEYYYASDRMVLLGTIYTVSAWILIWALMRDPLGVALSTISILICSFILFSLFEFFPSLITRFGLQAIPYYGFKTIYVPDATLGYRERPFRKQTRQSFEFRPLLNGINLPVTTLNWETDAEGFRNDANRQSADIILLGDSFVEYGDNEADTIAAKLEKRLGGLTVVNLGKSGYGPFQYLEVFRRFGINKRPKYALFGFYEGNDISDIRAYLNWKSNKDGHQTTYAIGSEPLYQRYIVAVKSTLHFLADRIWMSLNLAAKQLLDAQYIYADLVVIRLGNGETYKTAFDDKLSSGKADALLSSNEWTQLRVILTEFKNLATENNITPLIVYIPSSPEIYADYTTEDSGSQWRAIRDSQIASQGEAPQAMAALADQLKIGFIDLTPAYRETAYEGRMLYEPFNVHWNAAARDLAAGIIAGKLLPAGGPALRP